MRACLLMALLMSAATAGAGEGEPARKVAPRDGPYLGVQPGSRDYAPNTKRVRDRGRLRIVTWVGFQMIGQGGRVFVQASSPPVYSLVPGQADEIVLDLPDARLHRYNDGRKLETGWFPTAVAWIDAEQRRGNVVRVTIKLREVVGYDLRPEGNYLFFDFRPPTQPLMVPQLPSMKDAEPEHRGLYELGGAAPEAVPGEG